jgi:hypothetical protein
MMGMRTGAEAGPSVHSSDAVNQKLYRYRYCTTDWTTGMALSWHRLSEEFRLWAHVVVVVIIYPHHDTPEC